MLNKTIYPLIYLINRQTGVLTVHLAVQSANDPHFTSGSLVFDHYVIRGILYCDATMPSINLPLMAAPVV